MSPPETTPTPDPLNAIGVLKRREIEARIVAPLLEALGKEFGRERVLEIARDVIIGVARQQGAALAEGVGGDSLIHFAESTAAWKKDNALEIEVLELNEDRYSFNVTRCRYAEMYRALGIPELGAVLSCNRDFSLIEGFNPDVTLTRTQTIMQGAGYCNFRYERKPKATE
jgi:predicted hydrocarbon binding protein